jgi:heptaprenyl diphosphate synthase
VVDVYRHNIDTKELRDLIIKKTQHPLVKKYIDTPFIDDHKIVILSEIYHNVDMPLSIKRQSILTVMLVQIALDTHELIPVNGSSELTEAEKQLSVLAGDYYSGLYYLLLAEIDHIDIVNLLAGAIKQINEHKMSLFYDEAFSLDELMHQITEIESLLFTKVATFYGRPQHTIQLMKDTLLLHRLEQEIRHMEQGKGSYFKRLVHYHQLHQDPIKLIKTEVKQRKRVLEALQLPCFRFQPKEKELAYNISVAKEG